MATVTAPSPDSNTPPPRVPPDSSSGNKTTNPSSSPPPSNSTTPSSPPPSSSPPPASSPPPPSPSPSPPPPSPSPPPSSPPPASPPPTKASPPPSSTPSPSPPPPVESPPPKGTPSPPPPNGSPPSPPPPISSPPPPPGGASPPPPGGASPPPPSTNGTLPGSPPLASPPPPVGQTPPSTFMPPPPPPVASNNNSPPPPPPNKSPASGGSTSSRSSSSPTSPPSSSSTNTVIIIGAVAAGVLILAAVIIVVMCFTRKRKRKPYYMDTPPGARGDYFNGTTSWNTPTTPGDHIVRLPPPPGLMGTPQGGVPGWAPPPAPPAANTSSDYSSGFSGNHHIPPVQQPQSPLGLGNSQSSFTYEELAAATGGFSQANVLGQGGFGFVHKGLLPNGKEVAVKSLKVGSGQGEREFQAEVEIISRVHHRHLVSLVGYCIADGRRMLVYEFVPNKTMEYHLHGKGQPTMDWATRLRIAMGSAKGLAYLHEDCHPKIIHRDIKAANILLDNNFEAMVADFGLAKLSSDNYTHVSTRVMGTFGYLAPEYASSGKLSEKSDVFSFGVMLLELITGRQPVDLTNKIMEDSLVDWARPLLGQAMEDGNYDELVDPRLENNYVPLEMARVVSCAAASIRHSARRRPKMSQIVRALEGDSSLDDLKDGVKPGQSSTHGPNGSSNTQAAYDTGAYNADMLKFRKMVLSSQDFNSSEYGATSEYGLNPSSSSSEEMGHSGSSRHKF